MLWMSDAKDSHNDHKLRHWCHYWCAPRSCRLQVQNEMCMFNLESLETTGMVRCFAYINATSRSGKGEWRLIDNESTVCVVVFFESLDSPWLSIAVRCGAILIPTLEFQLHQLLRFRSQMIPCFCLNLTNRE